MEKLPLNVAQIARRQKVAISVYIFLISMNARHAGQSLASQSILQLGFFEDIKFI
jgi:hypothetical protein